MNHNYSFNAEDLSLEPMEEGPHNGVFGDFISRDRGSRPQAKTEQPRVEEKVPEPAPKLKPAGKANFLTEDRRVPDRRVGERRSAPRLTGDRRSAFGRRLKRAVLETE